MVQHVKPVRWMGSSWSDLKAFPDAARQEAGHQLFLVQGGESPEDYKPMSVIGGGAYEIRIHTQTEHRVFYVAKFPEAVYVLHAFEKRTRKTSQRDVDLTRRRYAEVIRSRAS